MTGMTTVPGSLILDHVSFRYARTGEDSGLDATPNPEDPIEDSIEDPMDITDLCLHVRPGETVLLCSESGCGKTTVTRLANGLIPHYHPGRLTGGVIVDGIDVPRTTIDALAGHVGSVFSNPHTRFFATRVDDELAFPCENMAIAPDEILRRMDGTMRDFAIAELADRNIDHLSSSGWPARAHPWPIPPSSCSTSPRRIWTFPPSPDSGDHCSPGGGRDGPSSSPSTGWHGWRGSSTGRSCSTGDESTAR
ncbi:MAG: ATP-binding cassette domain-containing protein [Bifidobacterium minimum]|jgi:hypothetical protein|nr:ATP-binding cassette domain-containing protein [Bifidobacterium minimum]